jgi:hypothetical protein
MLISEVRTPWRGGLAAIAVGLDREVTPLNHLGPHNALEWAVYLSLFALLVAVVVHVMRAGDDALPRVHKPRNRKTRPDRAPNSARGSSATSASDEWFDDRNPGP